MEESKILENMKDQRVVDVNCMTKKDKNVRTKNRLWFFTLASSKIPEYVTVGYECGFNLILKKQCTVTDTKILDTSLWCNEKIQINLLLINVLEPMALLNVMRTLSSVLTGGPHRSGSAEYNSLKKKTEILAPIWGHGVSYRKVKRKVEGLTIKPDPSYTSTATNNTLSVNNISQELAAKDKDTAKLMETV